MVLTVWTSRGQKGIARSPVRNRGGSPGGSRQRTRRGSRGFTLIELLIALAIIGILAAIAIPNLQGARRKALYTRAATDTKTATTQALVYQNEVGVYPGTVGQLRASGYANVQDGDPWGNAWVVSALFADTTVPLSAGISVHVCSEGPAGNGGINDDCDTADLTGIPPSGNLDGGVGYSATYGSWSGV